MNMTGHDTDLALARGDHAGAVRPDKARRRLTVELAADLEHIHHGDALRDADRQRHLRVDALEDRIGRRGGRDEDAGGVRARLLHRLFDRIEDGDALKGLAAATRGHASYDLRAVFEHLLRVELTGLSGHPLNHEARIIIDKNRHRFTQPDSPARRSSLRLPPWCRRRRSRVRYY